MFKSMYMIFENGYIVRQFIRRNSTTDAHTILLFEFQIQVRHYGLLYTAYSSLISLRPMKLTNDPLFAFHHTDPKLVSSIWCSPQRLTLVQLLFFYLWLCLFINSKFFFKNNLMTKNSLFKVNKWKYWDSNLGTAYFMYGSNFVRL
jgi:hypothetical protein